LMSAIDSRITPPGLAALIPRNRTRRIEIDIACGDISETANLVHQHAEAMISKLELVVRACRPGHGQDSAKTGLTFHSGKRDVNAQKISVVTVAVGIVGGRQGFFEQFISVGPCCGY